MKVNDLMSTNIYFVLPTASIGEVAIQMNKRNTGFIPVCTDNGLLQGVITDRDIVIRSLACNKPSLLAGDIMTTNVICASPKDSIQKIALVMSKQKIKRLPVINKNHLVGIISLGDLAKYKLFLCEIGDIYYAMVND